MNQLQIFRNNEFGEIRTIEENGKVLFCGSDVAKALGYARPNDAVSAHCRATVKRSTPISGKIQEINFIPESDVYRLVFSSKLPNAERFTDWVAEEVIPSIRKHGAYMTPETLEAAILNPDTMIRLCTALKDEQSKNAMLSGEVAKRDQIIAELNPKATYYDLVLQCAGAVSPSKIAKDYGKSAMWLNEKLHELGVQFKQGKVWLLYQKYASFGYTQSKTFPIVSNGEPDVKMSTYWTQKGRLFIYELLKSHGVIPLIEQGE